MFLLAQPVAVPSLWTLLWKEKNVQHWLREVLHVPEAHNSLLSVSRFDEGGGRMDFRDGTCKRYAKENQLVGTAKRCERLYRLDARAKNQPPERGYIAASKKLSWDAWHRLYGHIGISGLETLQKKGNGN